MLTEETAERKRHRRQHNKRCAHKRSASFELSSQFQRFNLHNGIIGACSTWEARQQVGCANWNWNATKSEVNKAQAAINTRIANGFAGRAKNIGARATKNINYKFYSCLFCLSASPCVSVCTCSWSNFLLWICVHCDSRGIHFKLKLKESSLLQTRSRQIVEMERIRLHVVGICERIMDRIPTSNLWIFSFMTFPFSEIANRSPMPHRQADSLKLPIFLSI